ncbi:MAG TPA: glutathione-disulfide reductase [Pseudomonadales bacterium]|nr:glutathione-disulfide reductase [Pseudomonadales bacterium]
MVKAWDLFVIGAGSGGVRAARMAASHGLKVAVAEQSALGGTCVNVGCVPKKLFYYGSHFSEDFHDAQQYGWDIRVNGFDWQVMRHKKDAEITRLNGIYQRLLENAGVTIVNGRARILDKHLVEVNGETHRFKTLLIATGGKPYVPNFPGSDLVITSNEAFYLDHLPKRIAVVGGGYIAVEFAGIFHGCGAQTHLIYRGEQLLRGFDSDVRDQVTRQVASKGVNLHLHTNIERIEKTGHAFIIHVTEGEPLEVDLVMYATGRRPYTDDLGLENVKVLRHADGTLQTNEYYQTDEPSIYAIGDVIGGMELTPIALAEAMVFVHNLRLADNKAQWQTLDYTNIPTAVFCQPNVATVGMSEEVARHHHKIKVFCSDFKAMKHTLTNNQERTFMKLVVCAETDRVLGAHMVGPEAGELIQGIAIAIKAGATKAIFDSTIGIHPTAAEEFVTMRSVTRQDA